MAKSKKAAPQKVGGLVFFASLLFLLVIGTSNFRQFIALIDVESVSNCFDFLVCFCLGAALSKLLLQGHLAVFIHEFKHALLSNIVGNRWKGMQVNRASGFYEYEFTSDTKQYNAFIALAPYWMPLFSFAPFLLAFIPKAREFPMLAIVATCFGADSYLNLKEIHPQQSDIIFIRGGYYIGLLYIFAANLVVFTILLTWAAQGNAGLKQLIFGLWQLTQSFIALV